MMYNNRGGLDYSQGHHSSSTSRKSSSSALSNPSVETTVTKLLMSTKQLLQTLTQWSKGMVNERTVSDAYVQLGNDFKLVSKFFSHSGLEVSDLGDVPMDLRRVLEVALREQPSDDTLNRYLPSIREIIVTLLDKLKVKQALLKSMKGEKNNRRGTPQQHSSAVNSMHFSDKSTPPSSRTPSVNFTARGHGQESFESRLQKKNTNALPEIAQGSSSAINAPTYPGSSTLSSAPTITSAPKQNLSETEALSELKKGNTLQRRASKRFSAYQMAKLTNRSATEAAAAGALASAPSPMVNAVNSASPPSFPISSPASLSPTLPADFMSKTLESPKAENRVNKVGVTDKAKGNEYDEQYKHQFTFMPAGNKSNISPKRTSTLDPGFRPPLLPENGDTDAKTELLDKKKKGRLDEGSYTFFLRMKGRTKKCQLRLPTSMHELQLLFVEKFAYSFDEDNFPDLYLQDPKFSTFYELDEQGLSNLYDGCLLELKVRDDRKENLKEVDNKDTNKTSETEISKMFSFLKEEIKRVQGEILNQIKEELKNHETSLTSRKVDEDLLSQNTPNSLPTPIQSAVSGETIRVLKQELSVLRQLHDDNKKKCEGTISALLSKLEDFKKSSLEFDKTSNNNRYVEDSQDKLGRLSDATLSKVDDLQDIIEVLRKDVAVHGVMPSRKKLDSVHKELASAEDDLSMMQMFMQNEKPQWKKTWKTELEKVCEEQQFLTLQEDLAADMKEDLGKAFETYNLVNLCCVERERHPKKSKNNPILPIPEPGTFHKIRDQVLNEVLALNPDHNERIEALERAEKMWEKEREYRDTDAFEDELGNFVEKGNLKTTGGIEEVERTRKKKDEDNFKAIFGGIRL